VIEDDKKANAEIFRTDGRGLVPPLVTTKFTVEDLGMRLYTRVLHAGIQNFFSIDHPFISVSFVKLLNIPNVVSFI